MEAACQSAHNLIEAHGRGHKFFSKATVLWCMYLPDSRVYIYQDRGWNC